MLMVAKKGREQELIDIFHRWGIDAVVARNVLAEPIVRILCGFYSEAVYWSKSC
jgi:phosphoribosylformylglycinamidine synthase